MTTTRAILNASLTARLKALSGVFTSGDLDNFLDNAIVGLYPTFFQRNVATTTATTGPIQTKPSGANNVYLVGLQRVGSNRSRPMRNWVEGDTTASIPKSNISGATLTWAWTSGWAAPATSSTTLTFPDGAYEVILIRAHITALEELLTNRISTGGYHAIQVRQAISEEEIVSTIQALHASLQDRLEHAILLPEVWK